MKKCCRQIYWLFYGLWYEWRERREHLSPNARLKKELFDNKGK